MTNEPSVESLKELGNVAVKNNNYEESVLHYTHAIKLEPSNYVLYSNRSFSFNKIGQYHFAMQDALSTIKLNPSWAKGYYRKAEVEFATHHYKDACKSYEIALAFQMHDETIIKALEKCRLYFLKDMRLDDQIPWVGCGVGIILSACMVVTDYLYTRNPTHPALLCFLTIFVSSIGYGLAKAYRYYVKCQRKSLLEPPINLLTDGKDDDITDETNSNLNSKCDNKPNHARYTKSQARQRYKKAKMS